MGSNDMMYDFKMVCWLWNCNGWLVCVLQQLYCVLEYYGDCGEEFEFSGYFVFFLVVVQDFVGVVEDCDVGVDYYCY